MRYSDSIHIGPAHFRIGSDWAKPLDALRHLYAPYPKARNIADFTVRLEAKSPLRRYIRPSVAIKGDLTIPDALPLPLEQGVLAAEMAMNLQMALGWRRHLLLHASSVEKNGHALMMTGLSGSGKSTLSAILGETGWRFMGDEFALLEPETGHAVPFPRAISLKNQAIAVMREIVADDSRFGTMLRGTPKGDICHLQPSKSAIADMHKPAIPKLLLFPSFGHQADIRPMRKDEAFVRLTQASTNYVALGEAGFRCLSGFVDKVPAYAMDFQQTDEAIKQVDMLWQEHGA